MGGFSASSRRVALLAAAALAGAAPAGAQSVADFYRRSGLTMYVGSGAGGGFDLYTRVFANHFARHAPGSLDKLGSLGSAR